MLGKQKGKWCKRCKGYRLAVGSKPNHILHLLLTLLTCGFWAVIWLLVIVGKTGRYYCSTCGLRV